MSPRAIGVGNLPHSYRVAIGERVESRGRRDRPRATSFAGREPRQKILCGGITHPRAPSIHRKGSTQDDSAQRCDRWSIHNHVSVRHTACQPWRAASADAAHTSNPFGAISKTQSGAHAAAAYSPSAPPPTSSAASRSCARNLSTSIQRSGSTKRPACWPLEWHLARLTVARCHSHAVFAPSSWRGARGGTAPTQCRRRRSVRWPRRLRSIAARVSLHCWLVWPLLPRARTAAVQQEHVGRRHERGLAMRGQLRRRPWALLLRRARLTLPAPAAPLLCALGAPEHAAARWPAGLSGVQCAVAAVGDGEAAVRATDQGAAMARRQLGAVVRQAL